MSVMNDSGHAPRKLVMYLAHPVSAPDQSGIDANLSNARAWLKWFVDHTSWAVSVPWMPYVETLAEESYRDLGLSDDLAMLERHDAIVLVGGRVSSGMALERRHAIECGLNVIDLTGFGDCPPVGHLASAAVLAAVRRLERDPLDGTRR